MFFDEKQEKKIECTLKVTNDDYFSFEKKIFFNFFFTFLFLFLNV